MLNDLIRLYVDAKLKWERRFDEDDTTAGNSPEWGEYMRLSFAIIEHRSDTIEEVRQRVAFIQSDGNLVDILASSVTEEAVRGFLSSLTTIPVEKSNSGEN